MAFLDETGLAELWSLIKKNRAPATHTTDKSNPHGVTAAQAGARPNTWLPTPAEIGAISMTLLWENASPSSAFDTQDLLGFDWAKYSHFLVVTTTGFTVLIPKGVILWCYGYHEKASTRSFQFIDTGFGCSTGQTTNTYGGSWVVDNTKMVPNWIYGLQGVQTA